MPLDENQLEDLRRIANTEPETLRLVVDKVRELKPEPISPNRLYATAKEAIADGQTAESFIRQALFNFWPIRKGGVSVPEVLENLRQALSTEPNWTEEDRARWPGAEPIFGDLMSLEIVRLVAGAIDLSYEHVNVYTTARILTDIRPIFNRDATEIEGAVIAHALHIQFHNMEGPHEVAIALDESDVEELAELCHRAMKKAETARSFMRDVGEIPTMISGRAGDA